MLVLWISALLLHRILAGPNWNSSVEEDFNEWLLEKIPNGEGEGESATGGLGSPNSVAWETDSLFPCHGLNPLPVRSLSRDSFEVEETGSLQLEAVTTDQVAEAVDMALALVSNSSIDLEYIFNQPVPSLDSDPGVAEYLIVKRNELLKQRPGWFHSHAQSPILAYSPKKSETGEGFIFTGKTTYGRKAVYQDQSQILRLYTTKMGMHFNEKSLIMSDGKRTNRKQRRKSNKNRKRGPKYLTKSLMEDEEQFRESYTVKEDALAVGIIEGGKVLLRAFGRPPILAMIYRNTKGVYIPIAATLDGNLVTVAVQPGDLLVAISIEILESGNLKFNEDEFKGDLGVLAVTLFNRCPEYKFFTPFVAISRIGYERIKSISKKVSVVNK